MTAFPSRDVLLPVFLLGLGSGCVHRSSTSPPSPPRGSIVTAEDIERQPGQPIEQVLMGRFPGVTVTPGKRPIRTCSIGWPGWRSMSSAVTIDPLGGLGGLVLLRWTHPEPSPSRNTGSNTSREGNAV